MTESILELKQLGKIFGSRQVLKDIGLSIHRGRVVGLLGKNGAGKTTLIKCVMGLQKVTSGSARLFGEDPWHLSGESKARIGYVPQKVDLYSSGIRNDDPKHGDLRTDLAGVPPLVQRGAGLRKPG